MSMLTRQGQDSQTAWYCQNLQKQHHSSGAGLSAVSALALVWYPWPASGSWRDTWSGHCRGSSLSMLQLSNATVREAPSLWSLCCPECRLVTYAASIHTLRRGSSIFYSSLLEVGRWLVTHKMLAPQSLKFYSIYTFWQTKASAFIGYKLHNFAIN